MMPKAQFFPANTDVEDIVFDTATEPEPQTDAQKKTSDLSSALKDDQASFVTIHKEENGRSMHVERLAADKFDVGQLLDYLQITYGGGDYRIRVYAEGKITANKLISIARKVVSDTQTVGQSPGGEVSQILGTILQTIQNQNERMMQVVQGNRENETDMLQKMMMYKQLFSNDTPQQNNGMAQLKESIETMQMLGVNIGTEKEDDGFGTLIEKMSPVIGAAMAQPQPTQPQPQGKNPMFGNFMLKSGISMLLKAAKKGADRITYAEMILDQLPEDKIREFITSADSGDKLIKYCPDVKNHSEWFDDLAEHVKGQLGMPSKYKNLYDADESDINAKTDEPQVTNYDTSDIPTT